MIWDSFKKVASLQFEVSFNPSLKPQQLNTKTDNQANRDETVAKMISKLDKSLKTMKWVGRKMRKQTGWDGFSARSICRDF